MRFLKPIFIGVLLLVIVLLGYLLLVKKEPVRAQIPFINKTLSLAPSDLGNLGETTSQQLSTLSDQSSEVTQHVEKVLGTSIQVNDQEGQPLHDRAIEYGRYLYCQQVVAEYNAAKVETDTP